MYMTYLKENKQEMNCLNWIRFELQHSECSNINTPAVLSLYTTCFPCLLHFFSCACFYWPFALSAPVTHSSGVSVCLTDSHHLKHSVTSLLMGKRNIGAQEAGTHLTLHFFHGAKDGAVIPASDVLSLCIWESCREDSGLLLLWFILPGVQQLS